MTRMPRSLLRTLVCLGLPVLGTAVQSASVAGIPRQVSWQTGAGIQAPGSCIPKPRGSEPIT
eukprot:5435918-Pyramimonas_sp.AAC.1